MKIDFKPGDLVRHIKNDYGYWKVNKVFPKGHLGKTYRLIEVYHSTNSAFLTGMVHTMKAIDFRKLEKLK